MLKTNASGDLVAAVAGTDYQAVLTNPVTGTGTATSVAYWSGTNTITSSSDLYWDNTNSRLGVGTNVPSYKLHVTGDIFGSTIYSSGDVIAYHSSDERLKDNITPIANPILKIQQISGYEFDWNNNQSIYKGHDVGVIAQEIEKIFPSLVNTNDTGYKGVKYDKLVALLIEGIKEQQKQIDELKQLIEKKCQ
jgi:hypothetical protein